MNRYKSPRLDKPVYKDQPAPYRVDLEIEGVDHSGDSYEGRVFVNNANATARTEPVPGKGYAGSFFVFGHGPCYGTTGHCDPSEGPPIHPYDYRPPHDLTPQRHAVDITKAVLALGVAEGDFTVTIVPVVNTEKDPYAQLDVLKFERLSVIAYDAALPEKTGEADAHT
jgi:tyrosinase